MKRLVTIKRCSRCGRKYRGSYNATRCACGGDLVKMVIVKGAE